MPIITLPGHPKKQLQVQGQPNLLAALQAAGIVLDAPCGGRCFCGKCLVYLSGQQMAPPTPAEAKVLATAHLPQAAMPAGGEWRLACGVTVSHDCTVYLPGTQTAVIETRGDHGIVQPCPAIRLADFAAPVLGMAVDVGTTTVAAYLQDLADGRTLATASAVNPQRSFGADVISRMEHAAQGPQQAQAVAGQIRTCLAELGGQLAQQAGVHSQQIAACYIAGNTAMMHLLAGLPVESLIRLPFTANYHAGFQLPAEQLGLPLAPGAQVTISPCLAGFVGGDALCAAVACDMDTTPQPVLLLDIGTNGEILLGDQNQVYACSAAAGPAFEGAHIRHGMAARQGAINTVRWQDGQLVCTTIGDLPAAGICGSGLIDAVAVLLQQGFMDETGRLCDLPDNLACMVDGQPACRLADEVALTAQDIRQVQLAKGAIAAGVQILLQESGLKLSDLSRVYLAGGFGSWVNPASAAAIGLLPMPLLHAVVSVGNAAGTGARQALLSTGHQARIEQLATHAMYIELSSHPSFQNCFMDCMMFE